MSDPVNHPKHYKASNGMEAIDVIEGFGLDKSFALGNATKYLLRAGRKGDALEDLKKARWYLTRRIEQIEPTPKSLADFDLCYLATPYSKYQLGIEAAFQDAAALAAKLLKLGVKVYSPITHTHPIAIQGQIDPKDHSIWLPFEERLMALANCIIVARMPGWNESFGIAHEIKFFADAGKPVFHLDPSTCAVVDAASRIGLV